MSMRIHLCLIVVSVWLAVVSTSSAGGPTAGGLRHGLRLRGVGEGLLHGPREHQCENCRIEMKTITRLVYEAVKETRETTVYDVITQQETIHEMQRIPVKQYREVPYTYHRKVFETQLREVPYTTSRPIHETHTREVPYLTYVPVHETRTFTVPYTVHQTIQEQRTRTVYHSVPRQVSCTKTVQVHGGHWETCLVDLPGEASQKNVQRPHQVCKRVWVPSVQQREITETRTVYDLKADVVPYTATRTVPVTLTKEVTRTYTRRVPVRQTRIEAYQVVRMISEQHVKTVPYTVQRSIPETGTRTVSFLSYQEVPTTRVIDVPRQVPRTVCYQVTRMVPRTQCIQVPVKICEPPGKGNGGQQKGGVKVRETFAEDVETIAEDVSAEKVAEGRGQTERLPPSGTVAAGFFLEG